MALSGLGLANELQGPPAQPSGPYANVPSSMMGNPAKRGRRGSFPLNTRQRAVAAESYQRYLPAAKRPAMLHNIHRLYPDLPGAKGY